MKLLNVLKIGVLSISGFVGSSSELIAQTTNTFYPSDDAYVSSNPWQSQTGNFPTIKIGTDNYSNRALVKFDLTSIPTNAVVSNVSLKLDGVNHVYSPHGNNTVLYRINQPWDESSVTWGNQPPISSSPFHGLATSTSSIQDYSINSGNSILQNIIQDMISNPSSNFGFMIKSPHEGSFKEYRNMEFGSSENSNYWQQPELIVTYIVPDEEFCVEFTIGEKQKDAFILENKPSTNYGSYPEFRASAWTYNGTHKNARSLIQCDLSFIPANAQVTQAYLHLKGHNTTTNGQHHGNNAGVLKRITSSWGENTVTWNTMPSIASGTTSLDQATIPQLSGTQNYSANIKDMVIDALNTGNNFGWMLKIDNEVPLRKLMFASGDHSDPNLHPTLEVCYVLVPSPPEPGKLANPIHEDNLVTKEAISLVPNPTSDYVMVENGVLNTELPTYVSIHSIDGKQIRTNVILNEANQIDLYDLDNGLYIITLKNGNNVYTNRVVKQ